MKTSGCMTIKRDREREHDITRESYRTGGVNERIARAQAMIWGAWMHSSRLR